MPGHIWSRRAAIVVSIAVVAGLGGAAIALSSTVELTVWVANGAGGNECRFETFATIEGS